LQRFCSRECRRALERVQERERHWKEARDLIPTLITELILAYIQPF
jgi:predicted nucleic acid-binding Zn ribbon protein